MGYTTYRHRQQYNGNLSEGEWEVVKSKEGQIQGKKRWFDFGWWAPDAIYKSCLIQKYTWNLYSLINQHHLNMLVNKIFLKRIPSQKNGKNHTSIKGIKIIILTMKYV